MIFNWIWTTRCIVQVTHVYLQAEIRWQMLQCFTRLEQLNNSITSTKRNKSLCFTNQSLVIIAAIGAAGGAVGYDAVARVAHRLLRGCGRAVSRRFLAWEGQLGVRGVTTYTYTTYTTYHWIQKGYKVKSLTDYIQVINWLYTGCKLVMNWLWTGYKLVIKL